MMDLAALRVRDTIKNLGDLSVIAQGFEAATGIAIDLDAVDYHTVMYNTLTVLSAGPPIVAPERTTDYVSHLAWYVNSARWAFEVIAEMCGFALDPVDVPGPQPSRHAPSYGHLVEALRARSVESPADYEAVSLYRHARRLRRVDEIGEQLLEADLDDVSALLGRRVSALGSDAELVEFIDRADEGHDERLIKVRPSGAAVASPARADGFVVAASSAAAPSPPRCRRRYR